jgi:hypothetical protein
MKTTENKSTHSQQHTKADQSSGEQERNRASFFEPAPEQTPFFRPGASSWVQPKFIGERSPFFSPSPTTTIQRKCTNCEAGEQSQVGAEPASETPNIQRMPAFESERAVQAKIMPGGATTTPQMQLASDTKEQEQQHEQSAQTFIVQRQPPRNSRRKSRMSRNDLKLPMNYRQFMHKRRKRLKIGSPV